MPPLLVKLVAMLLLLLQGVAAWGAGGVVCIPVGDCGRHGGIVHAECGHCDADGCRDDNGSDQSHDFEHGLVSLATLTGDECRCHIHVPVPESEQLPSTTRGDTSDLRSILVPLLVAFVLTWECEPELVAVERFKPPDFSVSDQVLSLKATRLLI